MEQHDADAAHATPLGAHAFVGDTAQPSVTWEASPASRPTPGGPRLITSSTQDATSIATSTSEDATTDGRIFDLCTFGSVEHERNTTSEVIGRSVDTQDGLAGCDEALVHGQ